jgi:hypothetical protein
MNRRGFLGLLGGAAAAVALDPERALWIPRRRLISVPRPSRPSRNVLLSPEQLSRMALGSLNDNLVLQRALNAQYSQLFEVIDAGWKIGAPIDVRRPSRFVSRFVSR